MYNNFEIGDIVSRDGTDEQEIIEIPDTFLPTIIVKCIKEPEPLRDGTIWCKLGEEEFNMARRYTLVRKKKIEIK